MKNVYLYTGNANSIILGKILLIGQVEMKKLITLFKKKQIEIKDIRDIVFEWIPYNQFTNIKEMNEDSLSAIWMDGSLYWETRNKNYTRKSNVGVVLEYSRNIQSIDEFLNEV
ncbi:hypothetical protein RirG_184900 [Rhizophagus irregularis DAOM 197198w]|uniref:Uncharacterized protein n=1 Tax=Rhizophagus irregularis (strain DAOM 197198w) TaxID=1432141 RepID=A0A015LYZ0_RHIIW|nr:hypothetical protein RirG_184900 [Rhizophagus irregularis DAOM 197198w]